MELFRTGAFFELLHHSIEEPIGPGDIALTLRVMDEPLLMVQEENSPICFTFGWDSREELTVFSLN